MALQSCALLYAVTALLGKEFSGSMATLVFGRGILAVLFLSFVLAIFQKTHIFTVGKKKFGQLFLIGCLLGLHWWTFFEGVQKSGVTVGALGFASFPACVVIIEMLFFKGKFSFYDGIVLVMVTVGLIIITPDFNLQAEGTIGLLWGVSSAFLYAVVIILNRQWTMHVQIIHSTAIQCLGLTCLFLPFGIDGFLHASVPDMWAIVFMGILCSGIAYTLYIYGMRGTSARVASVVIILEPIYAILIACVYYAEWPTWKIIAGAVLIMMAVVISSLKTTQQPQIKKMRSVAVSGNQST